MDAAILKQDVQEGRIDADQLVDHIVNFHGQLQTAKQQLQGKQLQLEATQDQLAAQHQELTATREQLHTTQEQLGAAQARIQVLEKQSGATTKVDEPYSMRAEEERQNKRNKKKRRRQAKAKRRGRKPTVDKIKLAERTEAVYPEGVPPHKCRLSHVRTVWRLEQHRAVLVAYQIYRGPQHRYGQIPGVLGRSEFGLEIVTELSYLVQIVGVSFDKACQILKFFQNMPMSKSQADALLKQLARHWEKEFATLCTLLANSLVVHADETSWSLNSVWAFLSERARVLLFGVHKDAETLKLLLDPETFVGLLISDDYAVYANFSKAQKCWAHLLRKAIKLALQAPDNEEYRNFADQLLEIYREACRVQRDQRLSAAGRALKVQELDERIMELCQARWFADQPGTGLEHDFNLLVKEVMRLMLANELFQFVTAAPVDLPNGTQQPVSGTNNEAERTLRSSAQARKTGRTNKTPAGARRRTVLTSVLESLRLYLPTFTLASVLAEIKRWEAAGRSCFQDLLDKLKLTVPPKPILDRLLPHPSG